MAASADREFKARCLFMLAKCSQKRVPFVSVWGDKYDEFIGKFKHNRHFPQLIEEYGNTAFYREAFNTCSYLRDFAKGK
jgi:hypothetical protein